MKSELILTIEDFKSIENGSLDLTLFLGSSMLVFNRRNYILYVENSNGTVTIYAYRFAFDGENLKYVDNIDVEKITFPNFIVEDDDCIVDAKKSLQFLVSMLTGRTASIFIDWSLPFTYEDAIISKDKSVLIQIPYSRLTIASIDFASIKIISEDACNSISAINDSAFNRLSHVLKICNEAFGYCRDLNDLSCTSNLQFIDESAFRSSSIRTIDLSLTQISSIGMFTFEDCDLLLRVDLPSTILIIDYNAFNRCPNLLTLCIQSNVKNISFHRHSFNGCSSLLSVVVNGYNIKDAVLSGKTTFLFDDDYNLVAM